MQLCLQLYYQIRLGLHMTSISWIRERRKRWSYKTPTQSEQPPRLEVSDKSYEVSSKVVTKLNGAKFPRCVTSPNDGKCYQKTPSPYSFCFPCTLHCVLKALAVWKASAYWIWTVFFFFFLNSHIKIWFILKPDEACMKLQPWTKI